MSKNKESKAQSSSGPWKVRKKDNGDYAVTKTSMKGLDSYIIATVERDITEEMELKKAHLIAAAPELLENFEKAIKLIEHMSEKFDYCVAVTINDGNRLIAKAKGEVE